MKHIIGAGLLKAVIVLSFLAMGVTAYLVYLHFEPSASSVCNINATFNCDIVNKSQWSYIEIGSVDIPVAIMGFLYYLAVFILSIGLFREWEYAKIHKYLTHKRVLRVLSVMTLFGALFSLYLTYIEAFVLYSFCLFCLAQQFIVLILLVLLIVAEYRHKAHVKRGA
jgi:uncharacterized membrane protein